MDRLGGSFSPKNNILFTTALIEKYSKCWSRFVTVFIRYKITLRNVSKKKSNQINIPTSSARDRNSCFFIISYPFSW